MTFLIQLRHFHAAHKPYGIHAVFHCSEAAEEHTGPGDP